ncbi:type I glutamate--ammonia ligase [Benzoatithermus flavus]|uniref:Type I glutamate--ammonia ligase n=1 Tax=Benzoatithermus flavus TaxID=3108223 RepID=A0ABU8XV76_9PROT
MSDPSSTIERIRAEAIRTVDFRFTDLTGRWRHVAREAGGVTADILRDGVFIDGSAVPGWRDVTEADLLLKPDLESAFVDPFSAQPSLVVICDVAEPGTGLGYERCPRATAQRAEAHLKGCRYADEVRVAAALAFFLFDEVKVEVGPLHGSYQLVASERRTSAAAGGRNDGHRPNPDAAYLALSPSDHMADIRAEIATVLAGLGVDGLKHAHGRATGQNELSFGTTGLVRGADRVQLAKYVIHQVAASYGKTATFMPRPVADEPGSGMDVHASLWCAGKPAFAGQGYADLSTLCLQFVAGVMQHARAINAFTNPTTNSYKRLRTGEDAPALLAYAAYNRSAAVRIPYASRPELKRIEVRFPDPSANPYLAFTAILMAGLDGIERKLEPGDAMDRNLYDLRPEEAEDLTSVSRSLREALDALEADHDFLTRGDVMPPDLIQAYLEVKRRECDVVAGTPHPVEFQLYLGL